MSGVRYEIEDACPGVVGVKLGANTWYLDDEQPEAGAIRQQARDIAELEVLAEIGRRWNADSSLETWFPLTAECVKRDALEMANVKLLLKATQDQLKNADAVLNDLFPVAEKLRADLAAAVAERDRLRRHWSAAVAERNETVSGLELRLRISRQSNKELRQRAEQAEARIAEIDNAPTVATVIAHTDQGEMWPALDYEDENLPPIGTGLIARPSKEST